MEIIVVDDEELALGGTLRCVREADPTCDPVGFSLPRRALGYARTHRVDVAFLDIEMPGMSGLALAKELKDANPDTRIVFVTSFEQYAVEAFSVHATGYLLKPARVESVRRELTFIYGERPRSEALLKVRTFGGFEAEAGGGTLSFGRSKTKELLALLVDKHGCSVTAREACAYLWEDEPSSASQRSYYRTLVADLRAVLADAGIQEVLAQSRNSLAINPKLVDCDSYRFLEGDAQAVNAYRGSYLPSYSWAEYTAGRLARTERARSAAGA